MTPSIEAKSRRDNLSFSFESFDDTCTSRVARVRENVSAGVRPTLNALVEEERRPRTRADKTNFGILSECKHFYLLRQGDQSSYEATIPYYVMCSVEGKNRVVICRGVVSRRKRSHHFNNDTSASTQSLISHQPAKQKKKGVFSVGRAKAIQWSLVTSYRRGEVFKAKFL